MGANHLALVSNACVRARCIIVALLCCSCGAGAQVSGRLFLDKETYAPGEPVFLRFEAKNDGKMPQNVIQADPYSFCSGYQVKVSTDPSAKSTCSGYGYVGSCLSTIRSLAAGETFSERILLNYEHEIKSPGEYDVDASRSLTDGYNYASPILEVKVHLHFRIDPSGEAPTAQLLRWVNQLQSRDALKKQEAARILASLAPTSLEDVLLNFVDDQDLRRWAPLALSRLHTERGLAGLAEIVKGAPGSSEHLQSTQYLAQTGDDKWFPLLADVAREKPQISNYVSYAAQAGGEKALPLLLELLQSPDKEFTQLNAAMALGDTGSRDAIPVLLNLLKNPSHDVADRAVYSLRQLTHRMYGSGDSSPQDQFSAWLQWWHREGSSAHIYKAGECSEFVPLN
jgi:HEAT repeat protein